MPNQKKPEVIDKRKFDSEGYRLPKESEEAVEAEAARFIYEAGRSYGPPTPILDNLLILRSKKDTHYGGSSIVIPETAQKDPNKGVVVAVSEALLGMGVPMGGLWVPCGVKPGDVVTFTQFCDETFTVGEDVYALVKIHDIKFVESVVFLSVAANA